MLIPTDVIRLKRDGLELSEEAIAGFLNAYTRGDIPDYQMSALAMAVFFRGLNARELAIWTRTMLHSGEVLDFSDIPLRKVDKHSTGGVGDKISLPLAPLVAACGVAIPMIAGRGLGHTGGTLDKLEAIPGFNCRLSAEQFRKCVTEVGFVLAGQSASLAPADKKLYALRDVTATVESIPLISASIMSKKLAEGLDGLVLDVKFGSGAFMRRIEDARKLAETMVGIGKSFGKQTVALLTNMNQPLGTTVGNALEIFETVDILQGKGPADSTELTMVLGVEMLLLGGVARTEAEARAQLLKAVESGAGLRKFEQIVEAQGGDPRALTDRSRMPRAAKQRAVQAQSSGFITSVQTDEVGRAAMLLGAGRKKVEDVIDPAVGIVLHKRLGDRIEAGELLATLHVNDETQVLPATRKLLGAYDIGPQRPALEPLVAERIA
jgi:pyrimidine-nucleoside phosphorylase